MKTRGKRGFRKLQFDEAFSYAAEEAAIAEELDGALTDLERKLLEEARGALANRLTPAFRQSSGPFESMVRKAAAAWMDANGGSMPNISDFIRNFQSRPDAKRARKFGPVAGDSAIRKILRKMGMRGEPGRPRRTP